MSGSLQRFLELVNELNTSNSTNEKPTIILKNPPSPSQNSTNEKPTIILKNPPSPNYAEQPRQNLNTQHAPRQQQNNMMDDFGGLFDFNHQKPHNQAGNRVVGAQKNDFNPHAVPSPSQNFTNKKPTIILKNPHEKTNQMEQNSNKIESLKKEVEERKKAKKKTRIDNSLANNLQRKYLRADEMDKFKNRYNNHNHNKGAGLLHYAAEENEFEIGKCLLNNIFNRINAKDIIYQIIIIFF